MFTGLVELTGTVAAFTEGAGSRRLVIDAGFIAPEVAIGESLAVNGCCLTVASIDRAALAFDLLAETLARTNLGGLRPGDAVNLERALAANARLGGHFVQGHIDCTSTVRSAADAGPDVLLEFTLPDAFRHYVVSKGSIAINGVSLTVATLTPGTFGVCVIPHTRNHTNLGALRSGDTVNLEFDILAKYIERMVSPTMSA